MVKFSDIAKDKAFEYMIYVVLWVLIFTFPVMQELSSGDRNYGFEWNSVFVFWISVLPFLAVFVLHRHLLLPLYIRKRKGAVYAAVTLAVVILFAFYQYGRHTGWQSHDCSPHSEFFAHPSHHIQQTGPGDKPAVPPGVVRPPRQGRIPLPVIMDTFLLVLLLGFNLAVVLIFKYTRTEEERKQLENMRMQDELKYLKSQINPHFLMNMLNNIHSMVEVNPVDAQKMIVDMSGLLRYVLYDGSNSSVTLSNEVQFISRYIELMRRRYPEDKVSISLDVPENPSASLLLPPLLFIAFIENAFKHGVSYMRKSEISISLIEESEMVHFRCVNSIPQVDTERVAQGGVGLSNVRRRLDLLYRDRYSLDVVKTDESYIVNLIIPGL